MVLADVASTALGHGAQVIAETTVSQEEVQVVRPRLERFCPHHEFIEEQVQVSD